MLCDYIVFVSQNKSGLNAWKS